MNLLPAFVIGFFLGLRHATDADHIVAVSTLLRRSAGVRGAMLTGALWGIGHSVTVILVGAAIVLFGVVVPPKAVPMADLAVAAMLLLLGLMNLVGNGRRGQTAHAHSHTHEPPPGPPRPARPSVRPLLIGLVHGLAGSAAVALLALTTLPSRAMAVVYLALFCGGTVAGMMLLTTLLALPLRYAASRSARMERWIVVAASALSIVLGLWIGGETIRGFVAG